MARLREPEALADHEWPPHFADPDAWATAGERYDAIMAWALEHHPSRRWPNFVDQPWMNASGLGIVEQRAFRAAGIESMAGLD